MPSWAWLGSSASSGNASLAWSMGNGGKGRMLIKFPLPLDGWYKEQPCTAFRVFQHRKERSGFKHEFIVLQLLDGSVCCIERMGDPDARFDALSPRGSVAHDMAQCFQPDELDQACLVTSEVIAEVELPCDFDLMDVLKICRAIHEGEKTRNYTLRVFNCYFFSLAIQVCLTRLVAHWEDQQLFERWLSQINTGILALPDTFQPFTDSSLRQGSILFRVYHALFPHDFDSTQGASLVEEIKHRLQLWIIERPGSTLQEIVYRANTLLWHSTIDLGLDQFVEEKTKEAVLTVVRERISLVLNACSEDDDTQSLPVKKLKGQAILLLTQLLAIAGASVNKIPKLDRISLKSKNIKARFQYSKPFQTPTGLGELSLKRKPIARATGSLAMDWYQWVTYYLSHMGLWLLYATLNVWGITLFTARNNLIRCTMIDEKLQRVADEVERLKPPGKAYLERLVEELRALSESQVAIWEKNPWADICSCIAKNVSVNILKENETHKPVIWFCPKGKRRFMVLQSISVFQVHIQNRIEMQAREVEGVWLGFAENIQAELVNTLSQVWKLIREDTTLIKKERGGTRPRRRRGSKSEFHAWVREIQRNRKLEVGEEMESESELESESSNDENRSIVSEPSRNGDSRPTKEQKDAQKNTDEAAISAYVEAVEEARKLQHAFSDPRFSSGLDRIEARPIGESWESWGDLDVLRAVQHMLATLAHKRNLVAKSPDPTISFLLRAPKRQQSSNEQRHSDTQAGYNRKYFVVFPCIYAIDPERNIYRVDENFQHNPVVAQPLQPSTAINVQGMLYLINSQGELGYQLGHDWVKEVFYADLQQALFEVKRCIENNNLGARGLWTDTTLGGESLGNTSSGPSISAHSIGSDNSHPLPQLSQCPNQSEIDNWFQQLKRCRAAQAKAGHPLQEVRCPLGTCAKVQRRPQALRDHLYFHFGIKPYKCQFGCQQTFETKANMERHTDTCPIRWGTQ